MTTPLEPARRARVAEHETAPPQRADALEVLARLEEIGRATTRLMEPILDGDWIARHHPVMGPVGWDLGHMAQQEDLWLVQTLGGLPPARADLNAMYDAYGHPRAVRALLPLPSRAETERLRTYVRARTKEVLERNARDDTDPRWRGLYLHKMVVLHEAQHQETILQHAACFPEGRYVPAFREPAKLDKAAQERAEVVSRTFIWHPGGRVRMGRARHTPWTYDNEWPEHHVDVRGFWLQRTPVTSAQFLRFIAAGGYVDKRFWSPAGWRFVLEEGWDAPLHWALRDGRWWRRSFDRWMPLDPMEPVMHVSWFEADACARFLGCRLATETEWEAAATFDPGAPGKRTWPWGEADSDPARANLDQVRWAPDPVGSHPAGASPLGVEQLIGDVWEWTSTEFREYPGFEAFPYDDYSKRFFGPDHRVLRGGSWATRSLLRLGTFRNWDLPQRRQVFAGFRLAADGLPDWGHAEGGASP